MTLDTDMVYLLAHDPHSPMPEWDDDPLILAYNQSIESWENHGKSW